MRNRYVLLLDLPLFALAALGAFVLRFDWLFLTYRPEFFAFVAVALAIKPPTFAAFGLYRRYWKYATATDLVAVVVGASAASVLVGLVVSVAVMTRYMDAFSRSVLLIDWILTIAAAGALRFSIRLLAERQHRRASGRASGRRPVLVVGAGDAGTAVVREILRNGSLGLAPVGFLDDDPVKYGKRIHGHRVLGRTIDLARVVAAYGIQEVIIAMPAAPGSAIRQIAQSCAEAGVTSRIVPGMYELLDGRISVNRLRDVDIIDLLRRPQRSGQAEAARYLAGRRVIVTGAGGSIGLELCRQAAHGGAAEILLLGHGENSIYEAELLLENAFPSAKVTTAIADVRDSERIGQLFSRFRPDVVFHAAAHKHVPLMEENPEEAVTNNIVGTQSVIENALAAGVERFVLISTDKAVEPRSVMGATKRVAEHLVVAAAARTGRPLAVVRFGNVLGSRGSVVPRFRRQMEAGGPITLTHPDMTRYFMTIPEAVHLVLCAGGLARGGELFVLNMGEPVRIAQLAQDLIALSGYAPDEMPIVYTGMRPGEKLEERLWEEGATVAATSHPDILQVTERAEHATAVPLEAFKEAARRGDRLEIDMLLAEQIATYVPQGMNAGDARLSGRTAGGS